MILAPEISGKGNWIARELWELCVFSADWSCPQLCPEPYPPIARLIAQSEASVGQDTVFLSGMTSLWGPDYIWQLQHFTWLRAPFFSVSAVNTILQCVMLPVLLILFLWIQHEAGLAHRFLSATVQKNPAINHQIVQLWVYHYCCSSRGVVELDGTSFVELKETKREIWKTCLLNIINTPASQQLTGGTTIINKHYQKMAAVEWVCATNWSLLAQSFVSKAPERHIFYSNIR